MQQKIEQMLGRFLLRHGIALSRCANPGRIVEAVRPLRPRIPESVRLIRLGGRNDGGYLIPDDLDGILACLSPGVDVSAKFERDLQARGIESHLIDFSVPGPPGDFKPGSFTKKFLGSTSLGHHVTLSDWMAGIELPPSGDLILQIDIEGSEYEVILDANRKTLDRFRIIVIELHHLASLTTKAFLPIFEAFAKKLTENHQVIHSHPNNVTQLLNIKGLKVPPVLELTLLRRDRLPQDANLLPPRLPHRLDDPNVVELPDYGLPEHWL